MRTVRCGQAASGRCSAPVAWAVARFDEDCGIQRWEHSPGDMFRPLYWPFFGEIPTGAVVPWRAAPFTAMISRWICTSHSHRLCHPGTGSLPPVARSEEHTSELQSLMRISDAVFCLQKKKTTTLKPTLPKS